MRMALSSYYGRGTDGMRDTGELQDSGEDGEITELHVNQSRPIINNTLSLIAGMDPVMKAEPRNSDSKALAQVRFAQALIEAYDTQLSSTELEIDCVRGGLIMSSMTLGQSWESREGKEWTRDENGEVLYEGDIDLFKLPPWRCAFDFAASHQAKRKWGLFYRQVSRWDTAAKLEESGDMEGARRVRDFVVGAPTVPTRVTSRLMSLDALLGERLPGEDVVWVWELRHLPTPALPDGRLVRFVEPDVVIWDSMAQQVKYPYEELHLYEFSPERVVTNWMGHTGAFDLGALQEFSDLCTASIATTVNINGQMHLWSPDTSPPNVHELSTGNNVLSSQTQPVPLEYPALKPEVLAALEWAVETARGTMALNNVVMGQPDKGMPASAQALQRAQAQQYHAVAQGERIRLRRDNVNGQLKLLKRFARSPRMAVLGGKGRQYELKEWQSTDIDEVALFSVKMVDPVSASFEGRQAILEHLMEMGAVKTPDALLTFLQTGSLAAVTATETARRELVEANVAKLQRGIGPPPVDAEASKLSPLGLPVFVLPPNGGEILVLSRMDPHHLAIPAYFGVLSAPPTREDPAMTAACTEAIQLSLQYWASLTPDECMAFQIPPLPSKMAMAMGGMPPSEGMPPGAPPDGPPEVDGAPPSTDEGPDLPSPPENPLTGGREDSGATGLVQ